MLGRRRIEIAEETIVAAYRAMEALQWIRNPMSFGDEASDRPKFAGESADDARLRDTYFVAFKRMKETSDDFVALGKMKTLCRVYFGTEVEDAIQELFRIRHEVSVAARMLTNSVGGQRLRGADDLGQKMQARIWADENEEDELTPRLDAAIRKISEVCEPHLR